MLLFLRNTILMDLKLALETLELMEVDSNAAKSHFALSDHPSN